MAVRRDPAHPFLAQDCQLAQVPAVPVDAGGELGRATASASQQRSGAFPDDGVGAGRVGAGRDERRADAVRLVAGFESTFTPLSGTDCFETTGHAGVWREDLDRVRATGVLDLRYPLLWHRIEREPGVFEWSGPDAVLEHLRSSGMRPVVDLVHHTSYPAWLAGGFADPRFPAAYERFAAQVAERYPWIGAYTLFNEPLATLFLAGHEGLWPPHGQGMPGLVLLLRQVLPAIVRAGAMWRQALPEALHVWVDTCEHHASGTASGRTYAELANDRRFALLDLVLGCRLDADRPFLRELVRAGGADLLSVGFLTDQPLRVDVLGLDYYVHSEWWYDAEGGHAPSPTPIGFATLARQYGDHYGLPMLVAETNIRGLPSDQVTWLRYMLLEYERARGDGVRLDGFCWFPHVDSCDWDSLLARGGAGRRDPVGVFALTPEGARRPTALTRAWEALAAGVRPTDLPAYLPQSPVREQLHGYREMLGGWPWRDPPDDEVVDPVVLPTLCEEFIMPPRTATAPAPVGDPLDLPLDRPCDRPLDGSPDRPLDRQGPDLVVLSHLRWQFVWQRPQHLITRLTAARAGTGGLTWFVEEPWARPGVREPRLRTEQRGDVTRVWLDVPVTDETPEGRLDFAVPAADSYTGLLTEVLAHSGASCPPHVWLYTPMALDIAEALEPDLLVYDVMDDLGSFAKAPAGLRLRQRRALRLADVVLAGGRSLHAGIAGRRPDAHLVPSGVDPAHYARSRRLRRPHKRPVAGFVGVIDERMDADLVAELARLLPDWEIQLVGPIAEFKFNRALAPQAPNITYLGQQEYADLPDVMAGFDVALMPFALNEATRSISPTKTLEYLAAGLPVVSTPVPDVVADFGSVVHLASTAQEFAAACRHVLTQSAAERDRAVQALGRRYEWDTIAARIHAVLEDALAGSAAYPSACRGESETSEVTA
jgi:glycosyltransferase involved in cell wall biosynthesis/beta-glucosidase/6-phospho-beta-glucosidase/beta-galactosidase